MQSVRCDGSPQQAARKRIQEQRSLHPRCHLRQLRAVAGRRLADVEALALQRLGLAHTGPSVAM